LFFDEDPQRDVAQENNIYYNSEEHALCIPKDRRGFRLENTLLIVSPYNNSLMIAEDTPITVATNKQQTSLCSDSFPFFDRKIFRKH